MQIGRIGSSIGAMMLGADDGGFKIADVSFNTRLTVQPGGNVGIGTTSPAAPLHIGYDSGTTPGVLIGGGTSATNFIGFAANRGMVGYDVTSNLALTAGSGKGIEFFVNGTNGTFPSGTEAMYVTNSGNVGIGTTSPATLLDVSGIIHSSVSADANLKLSKATGAASQFDNGSGTQNALIEANNSDNHLEFWTNTATSTSLVERMRITNLGNVLIGKTTQANTGYILDVNGNLRSNQIVVNTTGADFVFNPTYKLPELSEIKIYIDQNHHLPGVPTAETMQKDGLNVGDINTKLLQKVEELTLYMIEKDKQVKEQEARIAALETALAKLTTSK